ncbi:MAG: energy transducer TonB [Opitutae bacterium]
MSTRHRFIWIIVGVTHLALMAGLVVSDQSVFGGRRLNAENFVTVSLISEINAEPVSTNSIPKSSENLSSANSASVENKISLPVDLAAVPPVRHPSTIYTPPVFLVRENPQYPADALSESRQGKVVVKVFISAQGKVESTQILESSGSSVLDQAAELAARSSQFNPAERNHQPISAEATATYRFELR